MDMRQLETFLTLCRTNNFTRTAELLGYAQSSITAQIRQLENEMGVRLFDRIGKKVSLTAAGKSMIPYAKKIISVSVDMRETVSDSGSLAGSITVGAAESLCICHLPEIIRLFRERRPNADIRLKLLDCNQYIPMLTDGTVDAAFTLGDLIRDATVVSEFKRGEDIWVLSRPDHPLALYERVVPQDFSGEPFILTEAGCNYRRAFENDMAASGVRIRTVMETGSIQSIIEMASSGLGLCVLPSSAAKESVRRHRLKILNYDTGYPIYTQIIRHKDKWISPLLEDFLSISREYLKN